MTDITIGGKVPAVLLGEFMDRLNSTGVKVGRHGDADPAFKTAEQLRQVLDDNGYLILVADQDRQLDELEDFCTRHCIPFDRHTATGNISYRPGTKRRVPPDKGCDALLDTGNIRPLATEVARLVTTTLTREKLLAAVTKVIRHLNSLLPPELPPLEIEE